MVSIIKLQSQVLSTIMIMIGNGLEQNQPALTHLIRDITVIIFAKIIQNSFLQTWCVLDAIATIQLVTLVNSKFSSIKHCIQLPNLIPKQSNNSFIYWNMHTQAQTHNKSTCKKPINWLLTL